MIIIIFKKQQSKQQPFPNDRNSLKQYVENKPKVPILVQAYTGGVRPDYETAFQNNGYDSKLDAYPIKLGEVIEFVIVNIASTVNVSEAHPWQ
jgi:hypothetical protein